MTTAPVQEIPAATVLAESPTGKAPFSARLSVWLDRASEWFNPILVKESRQALKSRQFVVTFTFMLLVTWIATIVVVTACWPTIYYLPYGSYFLSTYAVILAIPLILVVPFSAFRSLAVEREDGTFELVSVTALTARQIVTGKLGSAFAQIAVYCSAIAPCLVFTYLLRGVDLVRILYLIGWTIAISAGLCCVGLLAATFSRARYMQTMLSVGLLLVLLGVGFSWFWIIMGVTYQGDSLPWGLYSFWAGMGYLLMLLVCLAVTSVLAASAQISFASDNHATPVRLSLFFTQALATGGFVYLTCLFEATAPLVVFVLLSGGFWAVAGSFLIGDSGFISERVRRTLPDSLFGRAFFSWFNPGGATAYVFTCVTLAIGVGAACLFAVSASENGWFKIVRNNQLSDLDISVAAILGVLYVCAYLGLANLILLAIRRYAPVTPVVSFVVTAFVALSACLIPLLIGIASDINYAPEFGGLQSPNWAWTIQETLDDGVEPYIVFIVAGYALPIFVVNVLLAYREIAATRTAMPTRVLEEERALHPEREVKHQPQNPWDDGERAEATPETA